MKKRPQKLLIIGPDPFISQSSPDHSPRPRIDFSYYEISGPDICYLICATVDCPGFLETDVTKKKWTLDMLAVSHSSNNTIFCLHGFVSLKKPRKWRTACTYEVWILIFTSAQFFKSVYIIVTFLLETGKYSGNFLEITFQFSWCVAFEAILHWRFICFKVYMICIQFWPCITLDINVDKGPFSMFPMSNLPSEFAP